MFCHLVRPPGSKAISKGGPLQWGRINLSSRSSDIDRWPDDKEWERKWLAQAQYKTARQPRLRYIFEAIEQAKRTALNEEITIRSGLTIEHIMPQKWRENWPLPGFGHLEPQEQDSDSAYITARMERDAVVDVLGNLTLLTGPLNTSVSNGPYSKKMPAVRSHSSLALNRELNNYDDWNETTIAVRGAALFSIARTRWVTPVRSLDPIQITDESDRLPPDGTECRFVYLGKQYDGQIRGGKLNVVGFDTPFKSFSAASRSVTQTSRNGWNDWHLKDAAGGWTLANDWRHR